MGRVIMPSGIQFFPEPFHFGCYFRLIGEKRILLFNAYLAAGIALDMGGAFVPRPNLSVPAPAPGKPCSDIGLQLLQILWHVIVLPLTHYCGAVGSEEIRVDNAVYSPDVHFCPFPELPRGMDSPLYDLRELVKLFFRMSN